MKDLQEQYELLSGRMPVALRWLYLLLIVLVVLGLIATCFVYLDVVVNAKGIIRPLKERTTIRAAAGGFIDSIWIREGQFIRKGEPLVVLNNEQHRLLAQKLHAELSRKQMLLSDVLTLTSNQLPQNLQPGLLKTPLYQEQYEQFVQQYSERKILQSLSEREFDIAEKLVKERIISPAEYDIKKSQYLQRSANLNSAFHQQLVFWNIEKQKLSGEIDNIQRQIDGLNAENEKMKLIAPVSGFVMGIKEHYSQSFLQPGEALCSISPEDSLIAECYVSSDHIGFLAPNQIVRINVDAFDHKHFGIISGIIHSIDNDFTLVNESPVFKIRCTIREGSLSLNNGYSAKLKKGMTIQARFMIAQRTIWQLFFDKLHNWLEPIVTV